MAFFLLYLFKDSKDALVLFLNHNFDYTLHTNALNENLKKENESLKKIIDFSENNDYQFITTKIKYRDVLDFKDTLTIYKGKEDGLKKGSVVLNELGLVGIVDEVDKHSARVQLITNKNSNISVRINDAYGILKFVNNKLIVDNITNYEKVEVGDAIYTSGIGNLPGGLYIGEVEEINLDKLEIEKIVYVKSPVDFNNLIYLLVIT